MFRKRTPQPEPRTPLSRPRPCRLFAPGFTDRTPAVLWEASATECGLTLERRLRPGDMVLMEPDGGGTLGLRVARVWQEGGNYLLQAEFLAPLSRAELQGLVGEPCPVA